MSVSDFESCSWSESSVVSPGSNCEWSSDESIEGHSTALFLTPTVPRSRVMNFNGESPQGAKPSKPQEILNCSMESCEWSDAEVKHKFNSSDGNTSFASRSVKRRRLTFEQSSRRTYSPQPSNEATTFPPPRRSPRKTYRIDDSLVRPIIRKSPRKIKQRKFFQTDSTSANRTTLSSSSSTISPTQSFYSTYEPWSLFDVMETNGCQENCFNLVHELSEYDVLSTHCCFASKTTAEQVFDYLATHCPNDKNDLKELKNITFLISGREVCLPVWLGILSISFYDIRREFVDGMLQPIPKKPRSIAPKSLKAIAWMTSYFDRVGDKRPDKDGLYLPTCLTERSIYSRMVEELYMGNETQTICFSQFNRIFRTTFPNVTIPKV